MSTKLSGTFCSITSTSIENEEVKFSTEITAISGANLGFPKLK
jgi:hypothetical protein